MQSCLAASEIRSLICEEIRLSGSPSRKTSLVALACSCRAFQGPALDSLWFKLDKISPIIRCLPNDAWELVLDPLSDLEKYSIFTRGLAESDFEIIRSYGTRTREIAISRICDVEISTLQLLSMLAGSLFPHLQRFCWDVQGDLYFPYIHAFLGKSLIDLDIFVGEMGVAGTTFINVLPSLLSPSALRRLRIRVGRSPQAGISSVTIDYSTWPSLRHLSLPGVTADGIPQIGKLPNLQNLSLGKLCQIPSGEQGENIVDALFMSLRSLELQKHPTSSKTLFPFFQHAKLESLSVVYDGNRACSDQEWREFFMSLSKNIDHSSLRRLQLQFYRLSLPTLLPCDILSPLLGFTELRSVEILLNDSLSLSHDEVLQIAQSWPHIIRLAFNASAFRPVRYNKLSSLFWWAKSCPQLQRLTLYVDACDNGDRVDLLSRLQTAEFEEFHSSLTYLNVGGSPISHKEFVALFLSKIFPKLEHIRARYSEHRRWERIEQMLLPLLRASQCSEKLGEGRNSTGRLKYWWADRNVEDEENESDSQAYSKALDKRLGCESDTDA